MGRRGKGGGENKRMSLYLRGEGGMKKIALNLPDPSANDIFFFSHGQETSFW